MKVVIGDVELDQHFFVQELASHFVILSEPYIMTAQIETKVLDNRSVYAQIQSQNGTSSIPNHEMNKDSLKLRVTIKRIVNSKYSSEGKQ